MKVAPKALLVPLSLRERAGVRETVMTPGRFHVEGVTPGVITVGVGGLNGYPGAGPPGSVWRCRSWRLPHSREAELPGLTLPSEEIGQVFGGGPARQRLCRTEVSRINRFPSPQPLSRRERGFKIEFLPSLGAW